MDDYRVEATVDDEYDKSDRINGIYIGCPVLLIRGADYQPDPLKPTWDRWAENVTEIAFDCGHFIVEERPMESTELMRTFFGTAEGAVSQ